MKFWNAILRAFKKKEIYLMAVNVRNSRDLTRLGNEWSWGVIMARITMSFAGNVFLADVYVNTSKVLGWELFSKQNEDSKILKFWY